MIGGLGMLCRLSRRSLKSTSDACNACFDSSVNFALFVWVYLSYRFIAVSPRRPLTSPDCCKYVNYWLWCYVTIGRWLKVENNDVYRKTAMRNICSDKDVTLTQNTQRLWWPAFHQNPPITLLGQIVAHQSL